MFQGSVGAEADPASAGRQMPSHWGHKDHNIVSTSSPTGTQFLQSVGCAEAGVYIHSRQDQLPGIPAQEDEVTLVCTGDGTTSQGEFWEAMNTACNLKAPVIFLVEDNGYTISTPVEAQTAGGSISNLVKDLARSLADRSCGFPRSCLSQPCIKAPRIGKGARAG